VQNYYKLGDPKEQLNIDFVVNFYERHDTGRVMASWWREDKKYTNRTSCWYQTANLREPYIYLMALVCRLYGEKDCSRFSEVSLGTPVHIEEEKGPEKTSSPIPDVQIQKVPQKEKEAESV
jgi:hypothetical protein